MRDEKFAAYVELDLSLARECGWEKEFKAREQVVWELHEQFPPVGSLALGHRLLDQKISYLRDRSTRPSARTMTDEAFRAVEELPVKDGWDYYYLGQSLIAGRGAPQDPARATEAFESSWQAGNPYAEFEVIWARFLAGGSRLEAILRLSALRGKLADFAAFSARSLTLLEFGPCREPGSPNHIARLLLLEQASQEFLYHTQGQRHINAAIEKELREGVDAIRFLDAPRSRLALYLTARASRANPTGKAPLEWFRSALDPNLEELQLFCRTGGLGFEELEIIVDAAKGGGWPEAPLALMASNQLETDHD